MLALKKIIVLKGKNNSGKTSTLLKVCKRLDKNAARVEEIPFYKYKKLKVSNEERLTVFYNVCSLTVGVCTSGDTEKIIKDRLGELNAKNSDIIFCACQSRGKTISAIGAFKNDGYKIEYIEKTISDDDSADDVCDVCNEIDCDKLIAASKLELLK